jgi:hypothetical protein
MERQHYERMNTTEKARIVAKGEARLGQQYFFGYSGKNSGKQIFQTVDQLLETEQEKFHAMYTNLFAKAVANLKSSQNLKRI